MSTTSTQGMSLYYFPTCPYCVRVLDAIRDLKLDIELRDTRENPAFHDEKVKATGKTQVPCLRIEQDGDDRWLYESEEIVDYLNDRFAA